MKHKEATASSRVLRGPAFLFFLIFELVFAAGIFGLEKSPVSPDHAPPFRPGEILKYEISWSKMVAGQAVMTVRQEKMSDGKPVLSFTLTGKSTGLVNKLYPVNDVVQSLVDPESMQSLSYTSTSLGKRKRHSSLVFDPDDNTVVYTLNSDPPKTIVVPGQIQDRLASLYYLRTISEYRVGRVFVIDVHEGGKNWAVEVHTLGRVRLKTDAGEFRTIKVKKPVHCTTEFFKKRARS